MDINLFLSDKMSVKTVRHTDERCKFYWSPIIPTGFRSIVSVNINTSFRRFIVKLKEEFVILLCLILLGYYHLTPFRSYM